VSNEREQVRLSRLETVAAWLRLWTPPRDAVVPPVPWRRLAIGGLLLVAALAAAGAYAIPRIDRSKDRTAAQERRLTAQRQAAERRRLIAEQRPVSGHAPRPAGPLSPAAELRARQRLLGIVEGRITADARRRAAAGKLQGRALRTDCVPAPSTVKRLGAERVLNRRRDAYDCLAVTQEIRPTKTNKAGALGYPFRAAVDFRRFSFAWCKTNPLPGERAVPDPRRIPPLPRACGGP
jgi:hypothetical protein